MLRIEDCKVGVEVIAIKNRETPSGRPLLSIGMIYTIVEVGDSYYSSFHKTLVNGNFIGVGEIDNKTAPRARGWAYQLEQFKLRKKEEFTELFNLNYISDEIKNEVYEDA